MSADRHARLSEAFARAVELASTQRAQVIAELRAEDPALAGELEALLAADARAAATADTYAGGALATGGLASALADEDAPEIPGFRIVDVLGTGAMGTVFAAEQAAPKRLVAIKVLHASSGPTLARFVAEAEIMARLEHPGIARVFAAGEAGGRPYLVMERVDGVPLGRAARDRPRETRLAWLAAICDAVHHAHVNGVIHRDLKPDNVLVRTGDEGRVTVLDFGVARVVGASSSAATRAGELIGTPLYMSPEQASLHADQVDARADVYSLGVMLYELCCDQLPYELEDLPLPAISAVICEAPPRRSPALRGDLEAVVLRALAKDPRERYQSASALADDVRNVLRGAPVTARTPGTLEQLRRFVRHRPLVAAAIAGVIAFAIAITVLWIEARDARRASDEARDALILREARTELARDPTHALALLATVPHAPEAVARAIADEARGRGVAEHAFVAHRDEIHGVEAIPHHPGELVTASYDGTVARWDARDRGTTIFTAARGRIHVARPSPDGAKIAVGGDDGAAHVIDRDGTLLATLPGHRGDVQRIEWDGDRLVTADDHGGVAVWERAALPGRPLAGPTKSITALAIDERGGAAIAGDAAGVVWLWNLTDAAAPARSLAIGTRVVGAWLAGDRAAIVDGDGVVRWLTVGADGLAVAAETATGRKCKHAVFAHGGAWALLGGLGGTVIRVEGPRAEIVIEHAAQARTVAISPDGAWLASGSDDGEVVAVDLAHRRQLHLAGHRVRVRHVELAQDARGHVLLSSDGDGGVRVWRLDDVPPTVLARARSVPDRLAASVDGTRLASVDGNGDLTVWTVADGGMTPRGHVDGHATALAWAGTALVVGTTEGTVAWSPGEGGPLVTATIAGSATAIAARRDGARVAVASSKGPITIFDRAGTRLGELPGDPGGTEAIAFDPSGAWLVSGGQDREIHVWDVEHGRALATLPGPTGDTHLVAFTPDGRRVLSGSNDGAVRAWTVGADGTIAPSSLTILARHTGMVAALAIDARGRWLVSAGRDRALVRVDLAGGSAVRTSLAAAPWTIVALPDGSVRTAGAGRSERWDGGEDGARIDVDHGALAVIAIGERWALALADGAIVLER